MRFVIPTIYSAVDQMSRPLQNITAAQQNLTAHTAMMQRQFTRLAPTLSDTSKRLISFAKDAAIAGSVMFGSKAIMDYETAVQSFRTIVSDLNDAQFTKFTDKIKDVANITRKSTTQVAGSFEAIAGLNAKFAETADGLSAVSSAAITLAKASRMDLQPAAENLVGIMNQFHFSADQADKTINALAAGQAVGAASISNTAEALNNFGASAFTANISLEQSIGLIQTMAQMGQNGADAGDKLKTSLIRIQQAGVGYKSGVFDIVDALEELKSKYDGLATAQQKDAFLSNTFGAYQITTGQILMGNIETFKQFTKSVTGTQEAFKAADINSNTLANRLDELKNKFVTLITTNQNAGWSLNALKTLVIGLTNNLGTLLNIAIPVAGIFLIWKGYIWGAQIATVALNAATIAYNTLIGISTALTGGSVIAMGASTTATTAYTAVTWLATAATTALNFVMAIGVGKLLLIGTAIVAGIALIKNIVGHIDGWGKLFDNTMGFMKNSFMSLFYYPLKVQFLGIKMHFMTMVEAIVLAWNWGMNKVGLMSDKQYQKEKDNIKSLQDARLQNIKTTVDEWKGSAGQAMSSGNDALRNSLKWKTNDEMDAANASNVVTTSNSYSEQKNVVEVHVKAAAGTNASIGNNSGNVPVVTSTSKY